MKLKTYLLITIPFIVILTLFLIIIIIPKYLEFTKIKNATIKVVLKKDKTIPFNSRVFVSDFIENINGSIEDDYEIDTTKIGKKTIDFKYINEEGLLLPFSYEIEIKDTTPPIVWLDSYYTVDTNFEGKLEDKILCADDTDDYPICTIEGEYDTSKTGSYNLVYIAKDASGNNTIKPFTLNVQKPSTGIPYTPSKVSFQEIFQKYHNENVKVGIDVSSWQGDIDFTKVKDAGVEFVIIRLGSKKGTNKEYFLDSKFEQNIKGFTEVGIPVGIYFYSYSGSKEESIMDAYYVLEHLGNYKIELPIAYDWEDWSNFNQYHLSLYNHTQNAVSFLETIENKGYKGMLYGSRNYLENLWLDVNYPIWLAHYAKETDYTKDYLFWQFSASGIVDGINGDVDLDLLYIK